MMNEKKFAVILCAPHADEYKHIVDMLDELLIPNGFELEVVMLSGSNNLATMYNMAMEHTDAKYKIYFQTRIKKIHNKLLEKILYYFSLDSKAAVLGIYGSELPMDADYLEAKEVYGSYCYQENETEIKVYAGKKPIFIQNVHIINDSFFVTCTNERWDVDMNGPFLMASYCTNIKCNGGNIIVPMQSVEENDIFVLFDDVFSNEYWTVNKIRYNEYRVRFIDKYRKKYLPKVTIAIPAYNQPKFFEQALNSAIQQTYGNIEILIGDDSTDMRIQKIVESYLSKYKHIRYFHHIRPLGKNGICNMEFLLEKAEGKYINLFFQDDLMKENKIENMMKYYICDLNNEIGIVTSSRYLIDKNNQILTKMFGFINGDDQVIGGLEAGRKVLQLGMNYIGEFSTVLLPKFVLYCANDGRYRIGVYNDFLDSSMCDISTFLNILKKGFKLVRIAKPLNSFRFHHEQNTFKKLIQIRARLDWLSIYFISYKKNDFIHYDEFYELCERFIIMNPLNIKIEEITYEEKQYFELYKKVIHFIMHRKWKDFSLTICKYILENKVIENDY